MNNALLSTMTIVPTYDQSHLLQSTIDALPELPILYDSASCRYYVDGGTTQKRIGGEQLFDASRINSVAAGSTSIKNNGDGSFTIVGQGNITESLSSSYTFTHEESVKLFPIGAYTFQYYNVYPYHYMQVKINNTPVISMFSTATSPTLTVTEEWASDPTFQICIGFAGNMDSPIKPGVVRPMLCRVPLVDWQPYVGGIPAPNPEYPMACENIYPSGNYKFEVNGAWYKLTLSDDLRSVDGIADRLWIEPRTGKAWVEKHVNVKNLVGTEVWVADTIASDTTKRYRLDGFNGWTDTSFCSHFSRTATDNDSIGYYGSDKSLYLKTDFANVVALKDYFLSKSEAGNPATVLYELEKAVLCPVSISEIVGIEGSAIELEGTVNSCAENFTIYGKTHQIETTGAQLFDASKLLTHSQGGATVKSNGDGSFEIIGSGTLSSGFLNSYTIDDKNEIKRLIKNGAIHSSLPITCPRFYIYGTNDANEVVFTTSIGSDPSATISNVDELAKVVIVFYGESGKEITPTTIRPMIWQDGDGTWEPYTGATSSPSPEYTQDIQGVGVRTKNLFDTDAWYDFLYSKKQDIYWVDDDHTILRWRGQSGHDAVNNRAFELPFAKVPENTWISLSFDGRKTVASEANETGICILENDNTASRVIATIGTQDGTDWVHKFACAKVSGNLTLTVTYNNNRYCEFKNIQIELSDHETSYEPYGYRTDVVSKNNSKNLLNQQRMLDFILQKPGVSIVQFDGRRCLKLDGRFNYPDFYLYEGFEPKKRYTLTFEGFYEKYYTSTGSSNGFAFEDQDGVRYALIHMLDIGTWKRQITTTNTGVKNLYFSYGTAGVVYIDLYTIQLEEGTVSTPYQPYGCYTTPIYSKSPVYESDKIEYRNNEYGLVRKNGLLTDNGKLDWIKYVYGSQWGVQRCFSVKVPDMINFIDSPTAATAKLNLICNRLPSGVFVGRDKPVSVGYSDKQRIYIRLDDEKYAGIDTAEQFKEWLADHPVEILYPLDKEAWEPLSFISQQALNNLKTFQNHTYIICKDRLSPEIEAKAKNLNRNLPLLYDTISNTTLKLKTKPGKIKEFALSGVTRQVETTGANLFGGKALADKIMELVPTAVLDTANRTIKYVASAIVDKVIFTGFEAGKQYTIILYGKSSNPDLITSNLRVKYSDGTYSRPLRFPEIKELYCIFTTDTTKTPVSLEGIWDSQTTILHYDKCGIFEGAIDLEAFEPYTGTQSSPSPEYPQDIQGVGKRTKNLFDKDAWYDFFYDKEQDIYWVDDDHTILRWRGSSGHDATNDIYYEFPIAKDVPENTWVTLSFDGRKTVLSEKQETGIRIRQNGVTTGFASMLAEDGTDWVHKFVCAKVSGNLTLTMTYNSNGYCEFKNIQIELSNQETSYEPYGYRTDVMTKTKNLVDISGAGLKYQLIPNGFVLNATDENHRVAWIPCNVKAGVMYTYRFRCKNSNPDYPVLLYLPIIKQYLTPNIDGDVLSGTFTPTADTDTLGIYFVAAAIGTGVIAEITELQVEKGNTSTPYQSYAYYTAPIYIQSPVYQGDKIQLVDGQYCHIQNSMTINGAELTWNEQLAGVSAFDDSYCSYAAVPGVLIAKEYGNIKSTQFRRDDTINNTNIQGTLLYNGMLRVRLKGITTLEAFKVWMAEHNPQFLLPLSEPRIEPLSAISQQALRNLSTYKGATMIGTTDPLEPEITVSYRPQTDYSKLPGLEVDYEKCTTTRLGAAKSLTAGSQFNRFPMYGNRRRCNVLDDGTITACHGDPNYKEDGSNGQVMVYQPKFYYQVVPLKTDPQTDGIGYHLRRAQYWVSPKPQPGFKLHPAFINASGQEVDHILLSAYESSLYDTSTATYILDDAQVMDVAVDKLSSIARAKPASGKTQQFTRPNVEQLAQNRGPGWHGDTIKAESANQLLMIIEQGTMNTQAAIGNGVALMSDTPNTENNSIVAGGTSSLGNGTGMADGDNGKVPVSYRGMENLWGNIWKQVYGVNIWGDGSKKGGIPYLCKDYDFSENKNTGNYEGAGFTLSNTNGYISAMGYSEEYDWLFLPSETLGNNSLPVGDYLYITPNLNGYRNSLFGGSWDSGSYAGTFCWGSIAAVGYSSRTIGSRLIYVPTDNLFNINRVFANPVPGATGYFKYDLGLSPGNYKWSIQKNEFLGSGQTVLITDSLDYYGSNYVEGKTYNWVGHTTLTKFCFTFGTFTVKDVMYIGTAFKTDMDTVKQLLKTLRIEKA